MSIVYLLIQIRLCERLEDSHSTWSYEKIAFFCQVSNYYSWKLDITSIWPISLIKMGAVNMLQWKGKIKGEFIIISNHLKVYIPITKEYIYTYKDVAFRCHKIFCFKFLLLLWYDIRKQSYNIPEESLDWGTLVGDIQNCHIQVLIKRFMSDPNLF